jgi:hypothetical protein
VPRTPHPTIAMELLVFAEELLVIIVDSPMAFGPLLEEDTAKEVTGHMESKEKMRTSIIA